ncbi:PilZ domain-containing protein [Sphingomonas sp.]|uniref:PilZ domain-containing protein n=1 Tax=Sphingomonas sp. TaxID=28214 RepID=UPI0025DA2729|nr:PilZ domain-containing protein [Sphingomonas sp.]
MIERSFQRKSVFIATTLHDGHSSAPVTLRNISRSGAMAESRCPPVTGAEVNLVRGRLASKARVVWSNDRRFAMRFEFPVTVEDWVAAPKNASQHVSDELFAHRASTNAFGGPRNTTSNTGSEATLHSTIEGGIAEAIALLISMGDHLSEDITVVAQYGGPLQKLERAVQILRAIEARKC